MRIGSLFAGIGGFDLAARWMGWETAWFSEIDPYASQVLAKHWPGVPNHGDITKIDFSTVEPVDLLCGGFPCQDVSVAGQRVGIEGSRSGLWNEYARAIRTLRPRYAVVENVPGLFDRGFGVVLGGLAGLGYDAWWTVLSACAVGAPHSRPRLFLVAYPDEVGCRSGRDFHPDIRGLDHWKTPKDQCRWEDVERRLRSFIQDRYGLPTDPRTAGVVDGIPRRVERCGGFGNAVLPQCAYVIFQAIQEAEMRAAA